MTIGRWASRELLQDGERPIFTPCVGCGFDEIVIRLTRKDYHDPMMKEWLEQSVFCRVNYARDYKITIEITPS